MKVVLGITCSMETSIIKQYQDEISYLQSLLDANGIPYDYEAYSMVQNKAGQKDVELMPLDIPLKWQNSSFQCSTVGLMSMLDAQRIRGISRSVVISGSQEFARKRTK